MIKLKKLDGKPIYITPEHCTAIESVGGETWLYTTESTTPCKVTESPEEVVRKIMEYKLAMAEYRALSEKLESSDCDKRLRSLTGLEESPDAK